ncbi:MAG: putative MFS family arabinose efflux permease [Acidimicrobiales bacterium]|jgi:predicted MFS family arabinose efflux permease
MWHTARWMAVFATSFRVNEQTDDPLLVQLVGVAFMAPMFLGGAAAGALTDRFDRHRTIAIWLGVLVPVSALMALLVAGGRAPIGVSYLFIFAVGIGNVLDMTTRRSLAYGLVGTGLLTNAAALETLALHAGNMVGSFVGGVMIEALGAASVYLGVMGICVAALFNLRTSRRFVQTAEPAAVVRSTSLMDEWRQALGLLRTNPSLRQFLATTVVMNFFYYSFVPLIPAFADDLGVGAVLTGVLASAIGAGTMVGALVISRRQPSRRGLLHIGGSFGAMLMLVVFANVTWYPAALAALFVAGLLGSGFGTTQSALVVSLVDDAKRGSALGVLSMAIGSLPFGMLSLGLLARRTDPQMALTISVCVGLVLLILWHVIYPNPRRLN